MNVYNPKGVGELAVVTGLGRSRVWLTKGFGGERLPSPHGQEAGILSRVQKRAKACTPPGHDDGRAADRRTPRGDFYRTTKGSRYDASDAPFTVTTRCQLPAGIDLSSFRL